MGRIEQRMRPVGVSEDGRLFHRDLALHPGVEGAEVVQRGQVTKTSSWSLLDIVQAQSAQSEDGALHVLAVLPDRLKATVVAWLKTIPAAV